MLKIPYWSSSFRIILSLDIAISFTWALASERVTLLRSFFCLLPCLSENKNKNQTLSLCQIRYHQHSSEGTMQNNFLNKSMFIMQSETKCNQEGAWLDFKRKCTQEWVWNQKQLWYLLDCDPQPLLPKHTEWMGLVPCAGLQAQFLNTGQTNWAHHPCAQWAKLSRSPVLVGLAGGTDWRQSAMGYTAEGCDAGEGCRFYWWQPHPLLLPSSWLLPILLDLTPINLNFGPLPRVLKNFIWV